MIHLNKTGEKRLREEELPVNYMMWLWLGAIVLFGVVEAVTAGLVSI